MMDDKDKNLIEKAAEAVADAAQTLTEGLKSAGRAAAENMTPKPIEAGDKLIIPSTDPSMPPVVLPARKRRTRAPASKAAGRKRRAGPGRITKKKAARKKAAKSKAATQTARRTASARSRHPTRKTSRKGAKARKAVGARRH
jgi:hypothetical protein